MVMLWESITVADPIVGAVGTFKEEVVMALDTLEDAEVPIPFKAVTLKE